MPSVKRYFILAILFPCLALIGLFVYFPTELSTIRDFFHDRGAMLAITLFALWAVDISARTLRLQCALKSIGTTAHFKNAMAISLISDFFASVSPSRILADPSKFYFLVKNGQTIKNSFLVLIVEMVGDICFLLILFSLPLFFDVWGMVGASEMSNGYLRYGLILALGISIVMSLGPLIYFIILVLPVKGLLKQSLVMSMLRKLKLDDQKMHDAIHDIGHAMSHIRTLKKKPIVGVIVLTCVFRLARLSVLVVILRGIALPAISAGLYFWQFICINSLIVFPLPAGGGAVEGGLMVFLKNVVELKDSFIPIVLLTWQFFISYGFSILGGVILYYSSLKKLKRGTV